MTELEVVAAAAFTAAEAAEAAADLAEDADLAAVAEDCGVDDKAGVSGACSIFRAWAASFGSSACYILSCCVVVVHSVFESSWDTQRIHSEFKIKSKILGTHGGKQSNQLCRSMRTLKYAV